MSNNDPISIDQAYLEAAWRYQLVAPLLLKSASETDKSRYRAQLLSGPIEHPFRGKITIGARTIRRWHGKALLHVTLPDDPIII